jgi:hypothetical protein
MLKYQKWLSAIIVFVSSYVYYLASQKVTMSSYPSALLSSLSSLPSTPSCLILSPFLIVLALGVYAVCDIMYVVLTFNDCKEAAAEIDRQVAEATKEMKKRKIGLKK